MALLKTYDRLRSMLGGGTYNQIGKLLTTGRVNEAELRKYYSRARQTALKRIKAVEGTNLAFVQNKPEFRTIKQMVTTSDLVREIADVNRFLAGKTTKAARREMRNQVINTLHEKGITFVNSNNFIRWTQFMDWARSTGVIKKNGRNGGYDSEADEVEETFKAAESAGISDFAGYKELFEAVTGREI